MIYSQEYSSLIIEDRTKIFNISGEHSISVSISKQVKFNDITLNFTSPIKIDRMQVGHNFSISNSNFITRK